MGIPFLRNKHSSTRCCWSQSESVTCPQTTLKPQGTACVFAVWQIKMCSMYEMHKALELVDVTRDLHKRTGRLVPTGRQAASPKLDTHGRLFPVFGLTMKRIIQRVINKASTYQQGQDKPSSSSANTHTHTHRYTHTHSRRKHIYKSCWPISFHVLISQQPHSHRHGLTVGRF